MLMPLSRTCTRTSASFCATSTVMAPPSLVYFAALLIRLPKSCARRVISPFTQTGCSGSVSFREWRCCRTAGWAASTVFLSTSHRSRRSRCMMTLPWVMRETSSKSSSRRVHHACTTWRLAISSVSLCIFGFMPSVLRIYRALLMGANGLRNSCASMARQTLSLLRSFSRSIFALRGQLTFQRPAQAGCRGRSWKPR